MFRPLTRTVPRVANAFTTQKRSMTVLPSGFLTGFYNTIAKSNTTYITFIVVGLVTAEAVYGSVTDRVWAANNDGKTYDTVDWSTFAEDEEEEEE